MVDDGRHMAGLYQFQPPLTPEDFNHNVDQMVSSGMDTLIYIAGLIGGSVLYDSKVAQKIGDNVDRWVHPVYYRTARSVQRLVSDGYDPMKLLCDRANEKGLWVLASAWSTVTGGIREPYVWEGGNSDFAFDNAHFQVGDDSDPRSENVDSTRFNFLHEQVREERFRLFKELLADYETDGIVLNFTEQVPLSKFSEVGELSAELNQWLGRLKAVATKAETAQGRRKLIYAKVPSHPDAWRMLGLDVSRWVSSGFVDGLICQKSLLGYLDQDCDLGWVKEVVRGTDCRVLVGTHASIGGQLHRVATPPMISAAAMNAYMEGADGFGFIGGGWTSGNWPWKNVEYDTIRLVSNPGLLAAGDKVYRARSTGKSRVTPNFSRHPEEGLEDWTPGGGVILPITLTEGKPVDVPIRISEDLDRWDGEGRVEHVRLEVRISGLEADLNDISIEFNGEALPDRLLQLEDLTFRYVYGDVVTPYGFVYKYGLTPEHYPQIGRNLVRVTLVRRDPNIEPPFQIYDINCTVKYRPHRNFIKEDLDY